MGINGLWFKNAQDIFHIYGYVKKANGTDNEWLIEYLSGR